MSSEAKDEELGRMKEMALFPPVGFGRAVGDARQECCLGLREEHILARRTENEKCHGMGNMSQAEKPAAST